MMSRRCLIPIAEWATFRETYVTPAELVRGPGLKSYHLVDMLGKRGIFLITGPKVDGGNLYVFRRNDLAGLDIANLAADSKLAK
jgi:hypothetical protein